MTNQERAEKRAIVEANTEESLDAAERLFVCYRSDGKMDSAAIYARKVIHIGQQRQDSEIWLDGYYRLAVAHLDTPNLDSAKFYLNLVIEKTENGQKYGEVKIRASAFMIYGAIYQEHNLGYEEAFLYFQRAIETSKEIKYTHAYVRSVMAQIEILMQRKRYGEINKLLTDAEHYVAKYDPDNYLPLTNLKKSKALFIATTATTEEERMEGLDLFLEVYELVDKHNRYGTKVFTFIDIAMHYAGDMPEENLIRMADENFNAAKDKLTGSAKGGLYEAYGNVMMQTKQYNKAIPYLVEAKEHLVGARHLGNYLAVCEKLMDAYQLTNQSEKVVSEFHDYKTFRDTLEATVYSNQLLDLEEKYKTEKKENENAQLLAQNKLIQTRFRFSYIIGFLLLGLLITGIYFFLKLRKNKQQLENLNQDKNKLFAILAHDLRNPIASLSNMAQKVKFLTEKGRLNELDELAENTDAKLSALNDNLNNILLRAITESNLVGVKPEQLSLKDEVDQMCELYTDAISQKQIVIQNNLTVSSYVNTDVRVIQTIIRNLFNNAIKFSHLGGTIEFSIKEEKGWTELQVIDNGIGLDVPEQQEESAALSIRRKGQGTGIGLKICRELAAKANLELSLVPNPKGGTIGIILFKTAA